MRTPPSTSGRPATKRWESYPMPTRVMRLSRRLGLLDHRVVLPAAAGLVARVPNEAVDLGQGGAVGGAGGGDHVLLHHQAAVVVGAEAEGDLSHLVPHGHPARLQIGHVVQHDPAE